ncbi:MAG: hypothetical protein DWQ06_04820 [Calditrichaeota bacterium]|nr:MAG: hypothetical protein DWQ06_04820 [Calditrichota bacterium]
MKIKRVRTNDGTDTIFNEKFGETYHSYTGAYEEALRKFTLPTQIQDFAETQNTIKILDVCFGLGYNSSVFAEIVTQINPKIKIKITGLENDSWILEQISQTEFPTENWQLFQTMQNFEIHSKNLDLKIFIADARKTLTNLSEKFDFVLFDPFSPKSCPELWEENLLEKITKVSKKGTKLTTYSCNKKFRKSLENLGWKTSDVKGVGRKSPSTLAEFSPQKSE